VALTCNEMTTLDNRSWILVHGYCVQDSCRVHVLLFVECILEGSNAQNLTKVMMTSIFNVASLTKVETPFRLLCFGVDGVSTFQSVRGGVIIQI
jgi:hypothetical protein